MMLAALLVGAAHPNIPPARTGECKWVQGRFAVYNGSSVQRIRLTGSSRIIALRDDAKDLPREVARYEQAAEPQPPLAGEFYVCALEPSRSGRMQHVRLLRTRRLTFQGKPYQP